MRPLVASLLFLTAGSGSTALAAPVEVPAPAPPGGSTYDPGRSLAPMVQAVEPAVVAIEVEGVVGGQSHELPPGFREFFGPLMQDFNPGPRVVRGEGSGFVISEDGLLVTNHHVIQGASTIRARFSGGETVEATLVGSDPNTDIALLRLPEDRSWSYVSFGDSDGLQVGDWVVAVGNPLGLGMTVTAGIISGKGRSLGHNPYDEFIQTDAAINQGNSGGPLFDLNGQVVGMNSAIIKYANTVGFSIPSRLVQRVIDDLREGGVVRRGFIGVSLQDPDRELADALGLARSGGALITEVHPDLPAANAGLRPGDVILKVGEVEVADSGSLIRAIGKHKPGEKVRLSVWRDGSARVIKVELADRPERDLMPQTRQRQPPAQMSSGSELARFGFKVRPNQAIGPAEPGLVVTEVDPAGPAAGRLQTGDRLIAINRSPITSVTEVEEALAAAGGSVIIEVLRGDSRRFVALTPAERRRR